MDGPSAPHVSIKVKFSIISIYPFFEPFLLLEKDIIETNNRKFLP